MINLAIIVGVTFAPTMNSIPTIDPDITWATPGYVEARGKEEKNQTSSNVQRTDYVGEDTEPLSDKGTTHDYLLSGAVLGACPEGSEGQDALLWVEHLAVYGGNNLGDSPEGTGGYVMYCYPDMEEVSAEPIVISVSTKDLQRLPLRGSGIVLKPDREDNIIRLPAIALANTTNPITIEERVPLLTG